MLRTDTIYDKNGEESNTGQLFDAALPRDNSI